MRVALDVALVRDEPAGVGVYVSQLAHALARADDVRVSLLGVRPEADSLQGISREVARLGFSTPNLGRGGVRSYHAWLQLRAAADAARTGASLAHYTNACAPVRSRLPYVLTVHDLSILRYPHLHPASRIATMPFMLGAVARARAVIVPSDAMRAELARGLRVSARRLVTVEHAATAVVGEGPEGRRVLGRLGLAPCDYLLSVGTLEPRKNIARLVGAFEHLAPERPELKLVLVGSAGWRRAGIDRRIAHSPYRDRIVITGYLPGPEVTALIRNAAAFCYVSVYEGFGLPVIEALAAGAAVVTSNRTGTVQAAGGAAVLVDPFSEEAIARGIREAISRRSELVAAGRERAARRSWVDVAGEHARVYRWASSRDR